MGDCGSLDRNSTPIVSNIVRDVCDVMQNCDAGSVICLSVSTCLLFEH